MLFRHTLLYLPAQIIGPLFLLISVVVWTHVTSDSTLGVITLITASHELLQTVFLAWWSQYALRFFGSYQTAEGSARFYRTENAIMLLSVIVQSAIAIVILWTVIAPDAGPALSLSVIAYVVTRSFNLYIAERARVRHEIAVYTIQVTTGPALGFLLGLLMIHLFGQAPEWPIAGYAIAQFVAVIAVLPIIGFGRAIGPIDRSILRDAVRYGIPLIVGGGLGWVSLNASRFIVSHMLGLGAAGMFAVGYGLGQRAALVAAMLVTASAFPIAIRQMEEGGSAVAMRQLADNGALLAAILFPSVAGIFVLRSEIVHLLIASPFQAATLAILPLSALAGAIRNFRAHFGDQVFLLHKRTRLSIVINGVEAAVAVVAGIILISRWGALGGAIASVVATATAAAISFSIGLSTFGLRPATSHLVRIAIATAAMALALTWLPQTASAFGLALRIILGAAIYLAVLAVLYGPKLAAWRSRGAGPLFDQRAPPLV
ncbi:MAG TPA: polysaccharide biosynthesis C-terminal domain-containing protein [Pseudolabrys sp.]|jgi:O-antigen/teichoic acid export membrane protein